MIELEKNQTRKVIEYCEQYFLCVIDKDKKSLLTYSFMPYLKVENGDVKFNVDFRMDSLKRVFEGLPVKLHAHRADDIQTAVRILEEFNLNYTIP